MQGEKHKADESAIRRLDEEWGKAATANNLEATVAFYAHDGSLVWPGQPAVHGTAHIHAAWKKMMDTIPGLNLRFTPERIVISGDASLASDFGKVEFGHEVRHSWPPGASSWRGAAASRRWWGWCRGRRRPLRCPARRGSAGR